MCPRTLRSFRLPLVLQLARSQLQLQATLQRRPALYRLAVNQRFGTPSSSDKPLLQLGSPQCWGRRHSLPFQGTMRVRSCSGRLGFLGRYQWCQPLNCLRCPPAAVSCRLWLHLQRPLPRSHSMALQLPRHRHQLNLQQRRQVLLHRPPHHLASRQAGCHRRRMKCRHLLHLQIFQKTCKRWSGTQLPGMIQQHHRTPQTHDRSRHHSRWRPSKLWSWMLGSMNGSHP
mmetsp:Transcript_13085/g.25192  ORF Transcript_13085/g.25192 Transcript_13085/m.25192 type:complete len:228 (-) Transcript_13085:475-1158(-)